MCIPILRLKRLMASIRLKPPKMYDLTCQHRDERPHSTDFSHSQMFTPLWESKITMATDIVTIAGFA